MIDKDFFVPRRGKSTTVDVIITSFIELLTPRSFLFLSQLSLISIDFTGSASLISIDFTSSASTGFAFTRSSSALVNSEVIRSAKSLPLAPSKLMFSLLLCHVTFSWSLSKTQVPPLGDRQLEFAAFSSSSRNAFKSANVLVHFSLFFF